MYRAIGVVAFCTTIALGCGRDGGSARSADAHGEHAHAQTEREGGEPHADHEHHAQPAADAIPGASIYQLGSTFTDHHGARTRLDTFAGHPVVVLLLYTTCTSACPALVQDVKRIEAELPSAARERLRVLLVSFDPERDTEERLADYARQRRLPPERWHLLRGNPADVRELAAVLGVRYRPLGDGEFGHTMLITLLDPAGEVVHRIEGLGQPVEALAERIVHLAAGPAS